MFHHSLLLAVAAEEILRLGTFTHGSYLTWSMKTFSISMMGFVEEDR